MLDTSSPEFRTMGLDSELPATPFGVQTSWRVVIGRAVYVPPTANHRMGRARVCC